MVDTRIVIVADIFVVILSLGAFWMTIGNPQSFPDGYNAFDVASMVGGFIGGQQVNPPSYTQQDYTAYVQSVMPPLITGSWELDVAIIALTAGLVLAFASFARWTLSLASGVLEVVGTLLWVAGISGIGNEAANRLAGWQGFTGRAVQISVSADVGAYIAAAGGVLFLATYFLTRAGRLDVPLDSTPPGSPAG